MSERFSKVAAVHNEHTLLWWEVARKLLEEYPESIPDSIHSLIDETFDETEILCTKNEIKDIQAWAIGLAGWSTTHPALRFFA